nr:unnamed protein product [Spirometra erinaceieuropaei]
MMSLLLSQVSAAPTVDVQSEAGCIRSCSNEYGRCLARANGLWHDYQHNRARIQAIVKRCCLYNEKNPEARESDSFATCVRIRCGALLYGCQIKKTHEGFMSPDEIFHLKQKQNKTHSAS